MRNWLISMVATFVILSSAFLCADDEYQYMDRLALVAGTDKGSSFHNYTEIYSKYFASLKDKPIKFLEIGIYKGNSVKLWESYFSQAELHFVDITPGYIQYFSTRSHYHFVDQANKQEMINFAQSVGGNFDIIVDDGGHTMQMQMNSFHALFPYVKSGGMYIIEDLHTSYWKIYGGNGTFAQPRAGKGTTIQFLQGLVDEMNYTGAVTQCADRNKVSPELQRNLNIYQDQIFSIHFYQSVCIIIKK